ncbi:hypothetical protein OVA19_00955 [Streptomyces sp. SL203]|nr:hypothetical protein [Streptomyces sp. SL203]MCY1649390.1 hypothetical protein [Streptomyces sp. SL203]
MTRTLDDLATQQGLRLQSYINTKQHLADDFPAPISSAGSRTRLYDGEQVDAFLAGQPVPALPTEDDHQDLLDRRECAAALGISPRTWDKYKTAYPLLAEHRVTIGGVEHWPRHILHQQQTQKAAKVTAPPGRPTRSGDQVPRDQLLPLTAPLLDADPTISAARVTEELGAHRDTAQEALRLRAERMAELMGADPSLTPEQSAGGARLPGRTGPLAPPSAPRPLCGPTARRPYLADAPGRAPGRMDRPRPPCPRSSTPPTIWSGKLAASWTAPVRRPRPWCGTSATGGAPPPPADTPSPRAPSRPHPATASDTSHRAPHPYQTPSPPHSGPNSTPYRPRAPKGLPWVLRRLRRSAGPAGAQRGEIKAHRTGRGDRA